MTVVDDRLTDGRRIAELLASELDGLGDDLAGVAVTDVDPAVEPTPGGARAYRVTARADGAGAGGWSGDADSAEDADDGEGGNGADSTVLASVFVQPDRARVEFLVAQDVAAAAGDENGLRVRPKAVRPPRTLVFVEDGAEVKRAVSVFEAVVATLDGSGERGGRDEPGARDRPDD